MEDAEAIFDALTCHLPFDLATLAWSYLSTSCVAEKTRGRLVDLRRPRDFIGTLCNWNAIVCFRVVDQEAHVIFGTTHFQFVCVDLKTSTQCVLHEFPYAPVRSVYDIQGRDEFLLVFEASLLLVGRDGVELIPRPVEAGYSRTVGFNTMLTTGSVCFINTSCETIRVFLFDPYVRKWTTSNY